MDVDDAQVFNYGCYSSSGVSEIEEEDSDAHLHNRNQRHDVQEHEGEEDNNIVYIAVGEGDTSMGAVSWTLNNLPTHHAKTILYLIHVYPEIKYIPNPLGGGMIPKNQVSPEEEDSYVVQERGKRKEHLQRFLQLCSASKVKVDTILIESDLIAKAILDLIPTLEIRNLVMGANKFHLRNGNSSRSRKGSGVADQILQNAPQSCKVRIICEGKEVNEQMMAGSPSPQPQEPNPPPRPGASANDTPIPMTRNKQEHKQNDSVSCICFKARFK